MATGADSTNMPAASGLAGDELGLLACGTARRQRPSLATFANARIVSNQSQSSVNEITVNSG
jgi:hypothetical protein